MRDLLRRIVRSYPHRSPHGRVGKTFAVYEKGNKKGFSQVNELQKQKRVQAFGEAIYTEGSHTVMWIQNTVDEIANRIIRDRESYFKTRLGKPPTHLS